MLTKRAVALLQIMKACDEEGEYADAEIVVDGVTCYLGDLPISYRTVTNLLFHCCISNASDEGSSLRRYTINGTGRASLEDPTVPDRIVAALMSKQSVDERGFPLEQ